MTEDRQPSVGDDDVFPVKFAPPALEQFRQAWPDMPPGDEVMLYMLREPCAICGNEITELGALDPVGITEDGILVGRQVCVSCIEEGH